MILGSLLDRLPPLYAVQPAVWSFKATVTSPATLFLQVLPIPQLLTACVTYPPRLDTLTLRNLIPFLAGSSPTPGLQPGLSSAPIYL